MIRQNDVSMALATLPSERTNLKFDDVDVRDEVPFGFACTSVSVEPQSGGIANGVGQKPGVVIFHPGDGGRCQNK